MPLAGPGTALAGNMNQPIHGDFNADGTVDRVVLGPAGNNPVCTLTVEYRRADGTYEPPRSHSFTSPYTRGPYCPDMGVAIDLGGKGKTDLVLTGFHFSSDKGSLFVLRDFALIRQYDGISFPSTIRTVDFNGDGLQDVWSSSDESHRISSFLNGKDEILRPGPVDACSFAPIPVHAFADFKGIGNNDMMLSRTCVRKGSFAEVYFGDGTHPVTLASSTDYAVGYEVYVGDFNFDGVPDAGVIERRRDSTLVRHFTNDGNGVFTETPALAKSG
jgi:hypothetical protein